MEENKVFNLNDILSSTNIDDVSAEGTGFEALANGYYLCEVKSATYTEANSKGMPMVTISFSVVENGIIDDIDEEGNPVFKRDTKNSINRVINKYYTLKDSTTVKRFVSDMLKFENPEEQGVSLLTKECFATEELIKESISILAFGSRIFVQSETKTDQKTNEPSTWYYLISWARAAKLGLLEIE